VSADLKLKLRAECDWSSNSPSAKCETLVDEMHAQIGHIDLYNMYGPCISGSAPQIAGSGSGVYKAPLGPAGSEKVRSTGPDACIDSVLGSEYMSRQEVYTAIHVRAPHIPGWQWKTCGSAPGWSYTSTRPNLPRDTYPFLIQHIRVVIYNGDW
jgi:serine carboxypeptidase-like clade 1